MLSDSLYPPSVSPHECAGCGLNALVSKSPRKTPSRDEPAQLGPSAPSLRIGHDGAIQSHVLSKPISGGRPEISTQPSVCSDHREAISLDRVCALTLVRFLQLTLPLCSPEHHGGEWPADELEDGHCCDLKHGLSASYYCIVHQYGPPIPIPGKPESRPALYRIREIPRQRYKFVRFKAKSRPGFGGSHRDWRRDDRKHARRWQASFDGLIAGGG